MFLHNLHLGETVQFLPKSVFQNGPRLETDLLLKSQVLLQNGPLLEANLQKYPEAGIKPWLPG